MILQCDPGELFVVRSVANIIPPYDQEGDHPSTSAALEYGVCYLQVKQIIIMGHSQCGGIQASLNPEALEQNDFISDWISLLNVDDIESKDPDQVAKQALNFSHDNCLSFPWIKSRVEQNQLTIVRWFFDIKTGEVWVYSPESNQFKPLSDDGSTRQ